MELTNFIKNNIGNFGKYLIKKNCVIFVMENSEIVKYYSGDVVYDFDYCIKVKHFLHIMKQKYPNSIRGKVGNTLIVNDGVYPFRLDRYTSLIIKVETSKRESETEVGMYRRNIIYYFIGKNRLNYIQKLYKTYKKLYTKYSSIDPNEYVLAYTYPTTEKWNYDFQSSNNSYDNQITPRTIFIPLTDMSNIFLNRKETILSKIVGFTKAHEYYKKYRIPYRLGILLYGKPGTGKTSFAIALSKYLGYDLHIATIDTLETIVNLQNSLELKNNRLIILIEELDTYFVNYSTLESREDSKSHIDTNIMRKFLTTMDLVSNGAIVIGTTNHIEKLDPAVIRSGRFDIKIETTDLTKSDAIKMIQAYNEDPDTIFGLIGRDRDINPSDLQNVLKQKKLEEIKNEIKFDATS